MPIADLIVEIDREIERLTEAKNLLTNSRSTIGLPTRKGRALSAAARRRIGLATKRRWAEKRAAEKKSAKK